MLLDWRLSFPVRAESAPTSDDWPLSFQIRAAPAPHTQDWQLEFSTEFDENQSLAIVKQGGTLVAAPLLMLVGGVLVDPVNGDDWVP